MVGALVQEAGPLALTTCRNTLIALRQFVRWLARSAAFRWEMPRGYAFPRCRIDKLPADRVKRRQHFKRAELALLWEYGHPWDRATILLALNCGFGKREIATLQRGEIVRKKGRTFIRRRRTKSDVYAEWEVWPETCAALEYLGRRANDTPYVVVNESGNPLVRGTPKGNENQTIKNHWDRLLERVGEGTPRLPPPAVQVPAEDGGHLRPKARFGGSGEHVPRPRRACGRQGPASVGLHVPTLAEGASGAGQAAVEAAAGPRRRRRPVEGNQLPHVATAQEGGAGVAPGGEELQGDRRDRQPASRDGRQGVP